MSNMKNLGSTIDDSGLIILLTWPAATNWLHKLQQTNKQGKLYSFKFNNFSLCFYGSLFATSLLHQTYFSTTNLACYTAIKLRNVNACVGDWFLYQKSF